MSTKSARWKTNLSWLNWNATWAAGSRRHGKIPVEKDSFKIASVLWSKTQSGTQQDVLRTCHVVIWRRKVQPFYVSERIKLGDKIVHKQNATNANLACTSSSEEVKVRTHPGEVNKCPSVLTKSVSWQILASFLGLFG